MLDYRHFGRSETHVVIHNSLLKVIRGENELSSKIHAFLCFHHIPVEHPFYEHEFPVMRKGKYRNLLEVSISRIIRRNVTKKQTSLQGIIVTDVGIIKFMFTSSKFTSFNFKYLIWRKLYKKVKPN